jgi:hypothetical protein
MKGEKATTNEQNLMILDELFSGFSEDLKTELKISDNELNIFPKMLSELFLVSSEPTETENVNFLTESLKLHNNQIKKEVVDLLDFHNNETEKMIARLRIAMLLRDKGVFKLNIKNSGHIKVVGNKEFSNRLVYFLNLLKPYYKTRGLEKSKLPKNLLFFAAIFLPSNIRETSLGDMEEIYKKDVKRFGVKKAKWLMFKDIVVSNYPIMKEFARKSAIKIVKFAGVYEAVRRIIG